MGYYLLDNRNPHGDHFYTSRKGNVLACVIHITAGLQDLDGGPDSSAERTARYAATTDRQVSWHSGSDTDSFLQLIPDSFTGFHCVNYNSVTIGHEISKTDVSWNDEPMQWVGQTLEMAAASLRPRLKALGIPLRHATKAELDRAKTSGTAPVGLIGHSELDPTRRRDPGSDFPWARFLALLEGTKTPVLTEEEDMPVIAKGTGPEKWLTDRLTSRRWIRRAATVDLLKREGVKEVSGPEYDQILADLPVGPEIP